MKIVYEINDRNGLVNLCKQQNITDAEIESILASGKDFHVIYTLEGSKGSGTLTYTLINAETKETISINTLNGYEKEYINDCFEHFHSGKGLKDGFITVIKQVA